MDFAKSHYRIDSNGLIKVISHDSVELGHKERFEYGPYSENQGPPKWIIDGHDIYDLMAPSFFGRDIHLYYLVVGVYSIAVAIDNLPLETRDEYPVLPRVLPVPEDFINNEVELALRGFARS